MSTRVLSNTAMAETLKKADNIGVVAEPAPPPTPIELHYIPNGEKSMRKLRDEVESKVILRTLQHTGWNRKQAAALLKISYRGLLYKISRNSITPASSR